MRLIFVYGSLKRGFALHHLLSDQPFVGVATTRALYRLFDLGSYPGLVDWPIGLPIEGELYRVSASCLARLDNAEGVSEGLYARRPIALEATGTDETCDAWFWLGSVSGLTDCGSRWPA